MRVNRHLLAITALFVIALSVRFIPFLTSNLPFNIDGFPLVRISEDIIESGHWDTDYPDGTSGFVTYNVKLPVMSLLISNFALIFGMTPMEVAQFVIPFMSSIAVIIIYAITFKITKNELVSFFAGLALALNGFYVYLGAAVMKETIGLVFLILAVYLYHERNDPKKRVLAAALLILLTLTHHLSAWMAFTMISLLALTQNAIWYSNGSFSTKRFGADLVSGPFMFVFTYLYYEGIDMNFFNRVSNLNDYALFASVFVIGFVLCVLFSMPKAREKPKSVIFNKTLIVPIAGSAFILLNAYEPIFEGTFRTPTSLLRLLLPYIILLGIALVGLNVIASRKNEYRPFIASLFLAPFLIIIFGFLKGFDAFTFILVYRSYDYIDFGVAICAGIGAGYLIKNIANYLTRKREESKAAFPIKAALSIIFIVVCLATVPLAYNGEEFYGIQDSTYQNEFSAMRWLSENDENYKVSTSERLSDIMAPYFDVDSDQTLPWKLRHNRSISGNSILFMEDKWTSIGAQMTPMEPFVIKQTIFDRTIENNDLIYSNSGSHADVFIILTR
jgi:uncharacterized membrane protein